MTNQPYGDGPVTHWEECWKDRSHWRCAVARVERLERQLAAMREAMRGVALAIGDRTHGAMASECQEWRERLEKAAGEKP